MITSEAHYNVQVELGGGIFRGKLTYLLIKFSQYKYKKQQKKKQHYFGTLVTDAPRDNSSRLHSSPTGHPALFIEVELLWLYGVCKIYYLYFYRFVILGKSSCKKASSFKIFFIISVITFVFVMV